MASVFAPGGMGASKRRDVLAALLAVDGHGGLRPLLFGST